MHGHKSDYGIAKVPLLFIIQSQFIGVIFPLILIAERYREDHIRGIAQSNPESRAFSCIQREQCVHTLMFINQSTYVMALDP